jgi:hypothetical protein
MEAYRGEPWFRDPYPQRPPTYAPDRQMEAYRSEPWFRDPYARRPPEREPHPGVETYRGELRSRDAHVRRPPEYEPDPWYQRYRPARSSAHVPYSLAGQKGGKAHTLRSMLMGAVLGGAAVAGARPLILDRPDVMAAINSGVVNLSDHLGHLQNGILDALWVHLPL